MKGSEEDRREYTCNIRYNIDYVEKRRVFVPFKKANCDVACRLTHVLALNSSRRLSIGSNNSSKATIFYFVIIFKSKRQTNQVMGYPILGLLSGRRLALF